MTRVIKLSITAGLIAFLLASNWFAKQIEPAAAQVQDNRWSEPFRLSNIENSATQASIVADPYGFVHAFWGEEWPDQVTTIQYANFDGQNWSSPLDILQTRGKVRSLKAVIDHENTIHLSWLGSQTGPVLYTKAPAHEAGTVQKWSPVVEIDIPAYHASFYIDGQGKIHLIYTIFFGEQPGDFYTNSEDEGNSWSSSKWLDPDIPMNYIPGGASITPDEVGGIHVLWYYTSLSETSGFGKWIRYTHSLDNGQTWSTPMTIEKAVDDGESVRMASASKLVTQGEKIHLLWAGPDKTYRNYKYSLDSGKAWSGSRRIDAFGDLQGMAGDSLVVDGAGRLHFIAQIRYPQAIYHAVWDGQWGVPSQVYLIASDAFDPIGDRIHAHGISATVRAGNQLVITFTNSPADPQRVLYTMHRTLDDVNPFQALPTQDGSKTQPLITSTSDNSQPADSETSLPMKSKTATSSTELQNNSPIIPIVLGLIPVLLLLLGFVIYNYLKK